MKNINTARKQFRNLGQKLLSISDNQKSDLAFLFFLTSY